MFKYFTVSKSIFKIHLLTLITQNITLVWIYSRIHVLKSVCEYMCEYSMFVTDISSFSDRMKAKR